MLSRRLHQLFSTMLLALLLVRVSAAEEPSSFSVVLLPDTQNYSQKFPDTYLGQTRWIRQQTQVDNIKFVIHLGDIVQDYNNVEDEWRVADRAHQVLDGVVPYSVLPGNHDLQSVKKKLVRDSHLFNKYFGPARFEKAAWYGGHFGETNDNNYCFFEGAGIKFMVLSLEYAPRDEVLDWANTIVAAHPECRIIVATHCYMRPKGRDKQAGMDYGLSDNSGEDIWNTLVRRNSNIFLVVSGHVLGVGRQISLNDAGLPVHEMLVDYQGLPNGGDGWLRILRFKPSENQIQVQTYSPRLDKYNDAKNQRFALKYEFTKHAQ